ncbi:MAG: peptide ABC transporter substrate-binding protein [Caldilineaceae bacterium]|nr:peptide ABC transporter substrate-binding protein [Caldilineaceae bacterium]
MKGLRKFTLIGLLLVAAMVFAACAGGAPAAPAADTGGEAAAESGGEAAADTGGEAAADGEQVLTILYWQAPSIPMAHLSGGTKDQDVSALIHEPLANITPEGELVPDLAVEIPTVENGGVSEDLTTITWKLKEGVKWSDGSDFTADDVVFTWEYCTNVDTGCVNISAFDGVQSVEAVDPLTVKITFEGPTPYPYLPFVTNYSGDIIQKAQFADCVGAAAQTCSEQNLAPHGTGPYMLEDFKVNDVATFVRNPYWRGEPAFFDRVIFKGGGDAASAARAVLETGEADYAWNLQVEPQILDEMEAAGNGEIMVNLATNVERLLVQQANVDPALGDMRGEWDNGNNPHPFLTFKPIPQAMSMAIDRNLIAEQLYGRAGVATCNVIPNPPNYVSTANDDCLVQDIEGAKALLDENGVVDTDGDGIREYNGIPLRVLYQTSTNSVRQKTQALIKQWWSEIGIETELKNVDAGVFFGTDPNSPDTYVKFFADIEMYTTGAAVDPQDHLAQWQCEFIASKANGWAGGNNFRGCSPEFDELFAQLTQTPVGPERDEIVKRLNDINVQEFFQIPLVHRGSVSARVNNLQGVRMNGGWESEMWNIEEWYRE